MRNENVDTIIVSPLKSVTQDEVVAALEEALSAVKNDGADAGKD